MKSFKQYLLEDKTHLINKLNLTPEQKEEAIAFFKKHPQREKEIDWNKKGVFWNKKGVSWNDLQQVIRGASTSSKLKRVHSISGMKEGKDYIELETGLEDWYAYIPLHHQASRAIASSRIGGVEGKWCTAENDDFYWGEYMYNRKWLLIYLINYEEETKFALIIEQQGFRVDSVWDEKNKKGTEEGIRLKDLVFRNLLSQTSELEKAKEEIWDIPSHWINIGIQTGDIKVKDAHYIFERNHVIWKSGTWIEGLWKSGEWESGIWKSGTWKWGTWRSGTWEGGTWKGGWWDGGYDKDGNFHPEGDSPDKW